MKTVRFIAWAIVAACIVFNAYTTGYRKGVHAMAEAVNETLDHLPVTLEAPKDQHDAEQGCEPKDEEGNQGSDL